MGLLIFKNIYRATFLSEVAVLHELQDDARLPGGGASQNGDATTRRQV